MSKVDVLREVVSPAILRRAGDISRLLAELGIPHVLIGGLAVGVHSHPRTTKDVDFLVGPEAFAKTLVMSEGSLEPTGGFEPPTC